MPPNHAQTGRTSSVAMTGGFEDQLWPIYVLIGVLSASAVGIVITYSEFPALENVAWNEAAQRLLAEAGYAGGEGFPSVSLLYSTSDSGKYLAEAFQQMWRKNLGVRVSILNQEWKVFLSTTEQMDYQIGMMGWGGDFLDPVTYLDLWTSNNGNNRTGYASAEYDARFERARMTNDVAERNRLFGEAETLVLHDQPIVPIYFRSRSFLCDPNVKGFPGNLIDYRRFDKMDLAEPGG